VVVAVLPGTPAAEAGLRRGDVVLAIGNVQIESRESLRRALAVWDDAEEDAPVPVSVLRDG
ncbi:MAG: PDZ domain-containing protein, partial [Gemmatimonadetes bacterium]|nr:PDZ domain-containing protein [Gemmatimonadota bacterium]NIT66706.1 PDZ domain-containing protein [Gemmatimonadota bacterium]NIV23323.1 PDZ domain-containing protein [Gemmatimonadota bacterium]NIW75137.1 PDZ domain-containing protein [Gemmatimonadota bacterium]NIY35283.1 PDZ domain-containing protein [Gemmatimonadota bacterium]